MSLAFTPRGNMVYEPDGKVLTEYFWDRHELAIIQGPIESGTSSASCHRIWSIACEQKPDFDGVRRSRFLVVRSTYKELRETTIKTWLDWFPESAWGPMIRGEPANHKLLRDHPSGDKTKVDCEVIFLALPDTDTAVQVLASFEITGFFVNEGQNTEKGIVDELLSRCARYPSKKNGPGATWHGGFVDLNAPREGHWIPYMRGDVPLPPGMTEDEREAFKKPDGWVFYVQPPGLLEKRVDGKIVYAPNPLAENQKWMTKPYIEKIEGKDRRWIQQRILNEVGLYGDGSAVYPTFSPADHVSGGFIRPVEGWPILVGLDFGRQPAAVACQCVMGQWYALSELIGNNESAERFAPKVRQHLFQMYPGHALEFYGDPRGADGGQNVETTAYDVFAANGMRVFPATTDNNPEMRRSTMERVLAKRNGLLIDPRCAVLKAGMAGGYHFPKVKLRGVSGLYSEKPLKNEYSHVVEALENALLGGGEGQSMIQVPRSEQKRISKPYRHQVKLRRVS